MNIFRKAPARLRAVHADLNQAERKVGDYVLENSGEIMRLTIIEVAQGSEVSERPFFKKYSARPSRPWANTLDGIDRRQFEAALRNVETLRVAKARGAASIAITRSPLSPLGRMANVVLSTASRETRFRAEALASRIAQTAILRRKTGLFLDMTPQKI